MELRQLAYGNCYLELKPNFRFYHLAVWKVDTESKGLS